jgi:tRNA dimethylallyltransferase
MSTPRAILIAGPTASGKSALALDLARTRGGVIVNADSMQLYRELAIITARPTPQDIVVAPHRLYGHVPAQQAHSVGLWLDEAASVIRQAHANGLMPILVGGTGLYFKALTEGLSPVPAIPPQIRTHWRDVATKARPGELHSLLAGRDAQMAARLAAADQQRIVRALEVLDATGRSLAWWQEQPGVPVLDPAACERIVVSLERDALDQRAEMRFARMIEAGAIDEAERFDALGLDPALPAARAIGLRPLIAHVRGTLSRADACSAGVAETRAYIKRQLTWLRRFMSDWQAFAPKNG